MYLNYLSNSLLPIWYKWLTLTWDVFKLLHSPIIYKKHYWLTLTWDVFKFPTMLNEEGKEEWLTLTWDVFKYICSFL